MFSIGTHYKNIRDGLSKYVAKFSGDERGVTMLEYTILIGIITVAVILAVVYAGSWVAVKWGILTSALT